MPKLFKIGNSIDGQNLYQRNAGGSIESNIVKARNAYASAFNVSVFKVV